MVLQSLDLTEDELIESIESMLAEELNVHPSDIDVIYDSETGVMTYTITSDDAESLADIITDIGQESFESTLANIDGVILDAHESPNDIIAIVEVVVDASSIEDVDSKVNAVTEALESQNNDYQVVSAGNIST